MYLGYILSYLNAGVLASSIIGGTESVEGDNGLACKVVDLIELASSLFLATRTRSAF